MHWGATVTSRGRLQASTGWQRMDSTQVLSNLAQMTRLELLVAVLQAVHRQLPEAAQQRWAGRWAQYLEGRPHQVCYKIPTAEVEVHLLTIGRELCAIEVELAQVRRVLDEQYERGSDGGTAPRPPGEVSASSLQSPHDPDATYRVVTSDFLAQGNADLKMLPGIPSELTTYTGKTMREAMEAWIARHSPATPRTDGRWLRDDTAVPDPGFAAAAARGGPLVP